MNSYLIIVFVKSSCLDVLYLPLKLNACLFYHKIRQDLVKKLKLLCTEILVYLEKFYGMKILSDFL